MQALLMGSVACKIMKNIYVNIIPNSNINLNKTVVYKYYLLCIIISAMEHLQTKFEKL